jgi:adenylate cyclase
VLILYFDLTLEQSLVLYGCCFLAALAGVLAALTARSQLRPIERWACGDRSAPHDAWEAALLAPRLLTTRLHPVLAPVFLGTLMPYLHHAADLDVVETITVTGTNTILVLASWLLSGVWLAQYLAPMLDDLAPEVTGAVAPARGWSLRFRLLATGLTMTTSSAVAASVVTLEWESRQGRYTSVLIASVVLGIYLTVIFRNGVVEPSLRPLGSLIAATRRVGRGDLTELVPVTSSDEFGDLAASFNEMQRGLRERQSLQAAFGSYVDPALAQRLLDQGDATFEGEDVDVSVLFADVRGFTSFAEGATAREAVHLLNRLFAIVVPVIREQEGHANHYLGDGVLAVFGTPNPLVDHADRAVAAAIEVQRRVRAEFGEDLSIGIGVNSGSVIAGTIGGGGKLEFTVIGDTVNVASRVEALTKETGDAILITEATRVALTTAGPRMRRRGTFDVRGKAQKVALHAIDPFVRTRRPVVDQVAAD